MKDFKYTINGSQYNVEVLKEEGDAVKLKVNGTPYSVKINHSTTTEESEKIAQPASANPSVASAAAPKKAAGPGKAIKAPLPGIILNIAVNIGDTIKEGDKLLTLEAMKMENLITSDLSGQVLDIKVEKGESVLEGADLVIVG
jgi:biotin carboxyl carrier protein